MDLESNDSVFSKLHLKLALSILLVLAVVLTLLIGTMNFYLTNSNKREALQFIETLVQNEGLLNPYIKKPLLSA